MRPARAISAEEEHLRVERRGPIDVFRRDPVEPEPVGTIVLMAFVVVGYDPDCDGSLMARLEAIDREGEPTGWDPTNLGLDPHATLVATAEEWRALFFEVASGK